MIACPSRTTAFAGAVAAALAIAGALAEGARADRVFWANDDLFKQVSFADLGGGGGGDLSTAGATTGGGAIGVAIDTATNRVYWANPGNNKISFTSLAGSGGGDLNTTGATVDAPGGVAIDPAARRIYWANGAANKISWAKLDGGGGGDLNTTGATVSVPLGVAVDPAAGKIYWASWYANKISWAKLDGSGGGDLATTGATVDGPIGVAVDPVGGRIWWANNSANKISFASLAGGGGGDLNTTGASVDGPEGVAVDAAAGKIYWAGSAAISFARLDGDGGADLNTSGATVSGPDGVALLEKPAAAIAPTITGGSAPGSVLACSGAAWAGDAPASFLYRPASDLAYRWSLDGTDIAGAAAASYTAFVPGDYRCTVTASNDVGSSSQTSAVHTVATPAQTPPAVVAPSVTQARESHRRWREGKRGAGFARRHAVPVGTTFYFTLNERATVTFTFAQRVRGRGIKRRWRLTFAGHSGLNKVLFQGRISRTKRLRPGDYRLTIAATKAGAGRSRPVTLAFAIVAAKRVRP